MTNKQQFCYWDVRSIPDAWITIVIMLIIIFYLIVALRRLFGWKVINHYNKNLIRFLYGLIIVWGVVEIGRKSYGITIYFQRMYQNEIIPAEMTQYSIAYTKFDVVPGFLVHSMFLQICYLYYKGLLNTIEWKHLTILQQRFRYFFNFYYIFRFLAQTTGMSLVFIYATWPEINLYSAIDVWILIIDAFIVTIVLIVSYRIFSKNFDQMVFLDEQDKKRLKLQYGVMILTSLCRIVIDLLFFTQFKQIIFGPGYQQQKCIGQFSDHLEFSIFYLIISTILSQLLPVGWILKIYDLESSSLLRSTVTSSEDSQSILIRDSLLHSSSLHSSF